MTAAMNSGQPQQSPWGAVLAAEQVVPGITSVTTMNHGGWLLDAQRWERFRVVFPAFRPSAGPMAFEEDCDWAVVVLAFPADFDDLELFGAYRTVDGFGKLSANQMTAVREWLASPAGAAVRERYERFREAVVNHWERGGCRAAPGGWEVTFYRVGDGAQARLRLPAVPEMRLYSEEQLVQWRTSAAVEMPGAGAMMQ